MYAIIETCGKQYKVCEGDVIFFEKLEGEVDKKIIFDKVCLISDEKETKIGNPYVDGYKVEGKIISHGKDKKIIVFKMKPKKNYRRTQGHRQPYTKIEILSIKGKEIKTEKLKEIKKVVEKVIKEEKPTTKKTVAKITTEKPKETKTVKKTAVKTTTTTKKTETK